MMSSRNDVPHRCAATPSAVFAAASIDLCTRLWLELDGLCAACGTAEDCRTAAWLATRVEALRLELTLVIDRCATRWRTRLDRAQCRWLASLMSDVFECLDQGADGLPDSDSIERAQNQLLEAILEQYADTTGAVDDAARSCRMPSPSVPLKIPQAEARLCP